MVEQQEPNRQPLDKLKLMDAFEPLEDTRRQESCEYPLQGLLLTAVCAISASADDWVEVVAWDREKLDWLRRFLPFRSDIASHDTFCTARCQGVRGLLHQVDGAFVPVVVRSRDPRRRQELARLAQTASSDGSSEFEAVDLCYFNNFGHRQDPNGVYAAVIPKWIDAMTKEKAVYINENREASRDFCYIDNVVQAAYWWATATSQAALNKFYNVAARGRTSLNQLFFNLQDNLSI